jgi:putative membrane protein
MGADSGGGDSQVDGDVRSLPPPCREDEVGQSVRHHQATRQTGRSGHRWRGTVARLAVSGTVAASAEEDATRLLVRLVVVGVALWLTILILPGLDYQGPFWEFVVVAAIFAVVNAFIRPVAQLLSLPISILTLGLFALVVNALMFLLADWLASDVLDLGLRVDGFWAAFFGALAMALTSWVIGLVLREPK